MTKPLCWYNIILIPLIHLIGVIGGISYLTFVQFNWATILLATIWFLLCGFSITGGYHRFFTHHSYDCIKPMKFLLLMFGAGSAQGNVLQWVSTHQQHHASDKNPKIEDPHSIKQGFWYAHVGWLFRKMPEIQDHYIRRIKKDSMVQYQAKHYGYFMIFWGFILPGLIAMSWDDAAGGLLIAGFLRTVVQWHITWSINSVSHTWGYRLFNRPDRSTNSKSLIFSAASVGEAKDHELHHEWPWAVGFKDSKIDPTKWVIILLSYVGVTKNLKWVDEETYEKALASAKSVH